MQKIQLYILILMLTSCSVEESTYTTSYIYNSSKHSIKISPYYQGNIVKEDSVNIGVNQTYKILDKNNRGKGSGFSYPLYIANYDSIQIRFDDSIQIHHYSFAASKSKTSFDGIVYDSNRSIYNESNYIRVIKNEDKYSISNEYTFTFTEQDYLDAQK